MRLATYNVENMFERPKAMNLDTWADGKAVLQDYRDLNELIQEPKYSAAIKSKLLKIMDRYKGLITKEESEFILLRRVREQFIARRKGKPAEIAANGRGDWIGWFELTKELVKETSTENTARVIDMVNADVQCVVEAEDRTGLRRFNQDMLPIVGAGVFDHVMLIDGNDERGIDVGIMTKQKYDIVQLRSHVDDKDDKGTIFSRDCAEYEIKTPQGNTLLVLLNHFKSKGYGTKAASDAKRLRQATRVREICNQRINDGYDYVAVVGDLNEVPDAAPMKPLIQGQPTLTDIMEHPKFQGDGRPGTFGSGTKSGKLDYILMSPKLSAKVELGGVERHGVWAGKNGTIFEHLSSMQTAVDAASDHAALWAELDI